jgi:hypothetical protein
VVRPLWSNHHHASALAQSWRVTQSKSNQNKHLVIKKKGNQKIEFIHEMGLCLAYPFDPLALAIKPHFSS